MPVYAYRCGSCGVQFERRQSFQDAPLTTCPECRKKTLKKVLAPVGIVFKGSGFYSTDHKATATGAAQTEKPEKKDETKKSEQSEPAKAPKAESAE